MGGANSTLSSAETAKVTQELKKKLEKYQSEDLDEKTIQAKLTDDFNHVVSALQKAKDVEDNSPKLSVDTGGDSQKGRSARITPSSASTKKEGLSSKFGGKSTKAGGGAKQTTRRRSFDANTMAKKPEAAAAPSPSTTTVTSPTGEVSLGTFSSDSPLPTVKEMVDAESTKAAKLTTTVDLPAEKAAEIADSWDSVTQQPFCKICQMAFKSETFLERHIKFSDLHTNNVKKKKAQEEAAAAPASAAGSLGLSPLVPDKLTPKQVEGEHFKLLYTGSKFFWRTQESVDLHFYHHILPHVIEVICYDNVKSKEVNRIYLDYTRMFDAILEMAKINEKKNKAGNAAEGAAPVVTVQELKKDEDAQRTAVTTFILQRLQWQAASSTTLAGDTASSTSASGANSPKPPSSVSGSNLLVSASASILPGISAVTNTPSNIMVFTKLSTDTFPRTPVLDKPPVVLIPVVITRRRRTNAEEIDATISSLTNDRAALAAATGQAEKIANLVYSSANSIMSQKWWAHLNPWRRKWIWAIRRVIRQRLVADTKRNLAERAARKQRQGVPGK